MVQDATAKKAPTELFIRKFAKIYTPIVVFLAIAICLLPMLFVDNYVFNDWLYRALVFLVISCPCALVITIPLGYFGGIGAASKNGILFKGTNFLDIMASIQIVVMDKTGTMTEGVFKVQEVVAVDISEADLVKFKAALRNQINTSCWNCHYRICKRFRKKCNRYRCRRNCRTRIKRKSRWKRNLGRKFQIDG